MNHKALDASLTLAPATKMLIINQIQHQVPNEWSLQRLVDSYLMSLEGCSGPFAVILNQQFVPKSDWANCQLSAGDQIETLSPVQGG